MAGKPFQFGPKPPRSLETFGVAGVLDDSAEVYSETLFNTTQLGRVSDLILAQTRSLGVSELRLRALLLFSIYEGYEAQLGERRQDGLTLTEPMVVECGTDGEKIVIGVSLNCSAGLLENFDGLEARILGGEPASVFDHILAEVYRNSDSVLVRIHRGIRRLEIISFLAKPGQISDEMMATQVAFAITELDASQDREPPSAIYRELADLDYTRLLADESKGLAADAPASGEILHKGFKELEDALRFRAQAKAEDSAESSILKIRGTPIDQDEGLVRIAGATQVTDDGLRVVSGGTDPFKDEMIEVLQRKIADLEARLQAAVAPAPAPVPSDQEADADDESVGELAGKTLRGLFGRVKEIKAKIVPDKPVAAVAPAEPSPATAAETPPAVAATVAVANSSEPSSPAPSLAEMPEFPEIPEAPVSEDDVAGNFLVELQQGSFERTLSRAQKESEEVRKEITSGKAKRWVDGLMTELMAEKSRLQEFAKKVNQTVKQRDLEFLRREAAYSEAIKKRDNLLRQKNAALSRAKDQVTLLSTNVDKLKSGPQRGGEEGHLKQKLDMAQRLMNVHKEENGQLQRRVEELTAKIGTYQASVKSRGSAEAVEYREKSERLTRQVDELRRANQGLLEKVNDTAARAKPGASHASAATAEELRRKLEAAMKIAAQNQKDAEMKQLRVEEFERETARLKKELETALGALKSLRKQAA